MHLIPDAIAHFWKRRLILPITDWKVWQTRTYIKGNGPPVARRHPCIRKLFRASICLAGGASLSLWLGQDANWDLLNYHVYNPFFLLKQRESIDIAAAGVQSFFNPLIDVPYYLFGTKWLASYPRIVAAIQGLYFGALLFFVLRINQELFPGRPFLAIIATAIGMTGAATVAEAGTTFNDIQIAALILGGALLLLPACRGHVARKTVFYSALPGMLFGVAAGLKFTGVIYAPAAVCGLLAAARPACRSVLTALVFGMGWIAGFILSYGYWGWLMWRITGNPFAPASNPVFHSDWFPPAFVMHNFKLYSWLDIATFPFYWSRLNRWVVTEIDFRDARFAIALILGTIFTLTAVCRSLSRATNGLPSRLSEQDRCVLFIFIFIIVSYIIWIVQLTTLRFAIPIEVLTGSIIVLALEMLPQFFPRSRDSQLVPIASSLLILAALSLSTIYPDWGRLPYGDRVFSVRVPQIPPNSLIIVNAQPHAFVLPFVEEPGMAAVGATSVTVRGYEIFYIVKKRISEHVGPLFVLNNKYYSFPSLVADLGIEWDESGCRPIESNLSPGMSLCPAYRR
jgi:hypothetical protein